MAQFPPKHLFRSHTETVISQRIDGFNRFLKEVVLTHIHLAEVAGFLGLNHEPVSQPHSLARQQRVTRFFDSTIDSDLLEALHEIDPDGEEDLGRGAGPQGNSCVRGTEYFEINNSCFGSDSHANLSQKESIELILELLDRQNTGELLLEVPVPPADS